VLSWGVVELYFVASAKRNRRVPPSQTEGGAERTPSCGEVLALQEFDVSRAMGDLALGVSISTRLACAPDLHAAGGSAVKAVVLLHGMSICCLAQQTRTVFETVQFEVLNAA